MQNPINKAFAAAFPVLLGEGILSQPMQNGRCPALPGIGLMFIISAE